MSSFQETVDDNVTIAPVRTEAGSDDAGAESGEARALSAAADSIDGQDSADPDTPAVTSQQPVGAVPSADEMEDRRDAQSSAQNVLPREKLENGLKHARMLLATGWAGFASSMRDLDNSEAVGKVKEGTVNILDRSMDGLSKVGSKVAEVTDKSVQAVSAKVEEAAPTMARWRDEVAIAGERGLTAAKEMTDKAIAEIRKPGSGRTGGDASASAASGASIGVAEGKPSGEDGPHTV